MLIAIVYNCIHHEGDRMYMYKKEGKRDSGTSIKRVATNLSTGKSLPCEKSNFRMKLPAVPQTIMHSWRKQTDSKILSNTAQQTPIQMFVQKNEQGNVSKNELKHSLFYDWVYDLNCFRLSIPKRKRNTSY